MQGLKKKELNKNLQRNKFSSYLPLLYRHKDSGESDKFLCQDNTIGYAWELSPCAFLSDKQAVYLEQILSIDYPKSTVMQFILHADENVEPIIKNFLDAKVLKDDLLQKASLQTANFLRKEAEGMRKMGEIPIRNYRCFAYIKSPEGIDAYTLSNIEEALKGANLHPERINAEDIVSWYKQIFNNEYRTRDTIHLDESKPINEQIINSDSIIDFDEKNNKVGGKHVSVVTPKELGKNINSLCFNRMFGGYAKATEDQTQIISPYIFSLNIIFDSIESEVKRKATIVTSQRFGGTMAQALNKRISEFTKVVSDIDDGKKLIKIIPSMVIYDKDRKKLNTSLSRVKSCWSADEESGQWRLQEETKIAKIIFLASLPFGLYHVGRNVKMIDRHFINNTESVSKMLPVQAEFKGSINDPSTLYICRKGQLGGLNIGHTNTSSNFLVSAESGGGKSYFLNKFLLDERARKTKIRVLDIGGSYKKMAMALGGKYIDFESAAICINPLDFRVPIIESTGLPDLEDYDKARDVAVTVIGEMVYSASGKVMLETEWTILKMAVDWALSDKEKIIAGIDSIIEYCRNVSAHIKDATNNIISTALEMSFNLYDFSSVGKYGRYFCGKSNFDIATDEFVIIELERIRARRELFSVVVMQMLNLVTADLYLGDRSTRTICLFEEVASLLKKQGHKDLSQLGSIIDEGYRRARKYAGAFGVVFQSLLDLKKFGDLGDVIRENSSYKFLLQGKTYKEASENNLVPYKGLALDLVDSTKNQKPRYSEVFVDSPFGLGIFRLYVDPWTSALCSSEPTDVAIFERLLKEGLSPLEAVTKLSGVTI